MAKLSKNPFLNSIKTTSVGVIILFIVFFTGALAVFGVITEDQAAKIGALLTALATGLGHIASKDADRTGAPPKELDEEGRIE
jgi:hypothetical protein